MSRELTYLYMGKPAEYWAELEATIAERDATIAELRVLVDCLPILIRGLKHYGDRQTLRDWDRARRRLEKKG